MATTEKGGLLPPVDHIETVSRHIAFAVARAAIEQGVAPAMEDEMLLARIEETGGKQIMPRTAGLRCSHGLPSRYGEGIL